MTMNSKAFIFLLLLFSFISCNNHDNSSAYEELLSRQPYANLTDSIHKNSSDPDLYYRRGMLLYKKMIQQVLSKHWNRLIISLLSMKIFVIILLLSMPRAKTLKL